MDLLRIVPESPAKGSTVQYQPGRAGGLRHERDGRGGGGGTAHALAGLVGLGGGGAGALAAMASLAHSQIHERGRAEAAERERTGPESSYNMSVPNELIGSVIGKSAAEHSTHIRSCLYYCYHQAREAAR